MALELANNAVSTLAADIGPGATTLTVAAGQGARFPDTSGGAQFMVTLVSRQADVEIMRCTGRSGDTFSVTRAQEGTAAASFLAGDPVDLRLTVGSLDEYVNQRLGTASALDVVTSASDNSSGRIPDVSWFRSNTNKMGVSTTFTATFTKATNNISATDIVPMFGLEVGDVIVVSGTTSNNLTITVESITDDDNIITNYEHRNGAGSLSLTDEGPVSCTIKLLCKWWLAPLGLGQDWVDVKPVGVNNTNYTNSSGRLISVSVTSTVNSVSTVVAVYAEIYVDDNIVAFMRNDYISGSYRSSAFVTAQIPANRTYKINVVGTTIGYWSELR